MGLLDVLFADVVDEGCESIDVDDDVFVDSEDEGFEDDSFVSSASSTPSTSTSSDDDDVEQTSNVIRLLRRRRDDEEAETCRVCLGRRLGAGGFGRVYEGELDCADERGRRRRRKVAVKLSRHRSFGSSALETASDDSFLAESAIAGLSHPNVVGVLAAGWVYDRPSDSTEVNMVPAIVMEFAGHHNLQSIVDDPSQTLCLHRRLRYASEVTSALYYIHQRRIVHLDVKPSNVIVTDADRCKLADFGCSLRLQSTVDDDDDVQTENAIRPRTGRPACPPRRPGTPTLNGTFAYQAPELLRSGAVTTAADVFSLGITLWQLRSRSLPYAGRHCHAVVFAVVAYHDRPDTSPGLRRRRRSSSTHQPTTSVSWQDLTARTPEHRYRNVYRRCWDADATVRPNTGELMGLFERWRTEMDCCSSTSSFDTDDD